MRLIDAEKLAEYKASGILELTERQQGWNYAIDTIMSEAPTVDAEPVKHGEWIPKITELGTMIFRCSACQRFSDVHWAYCPQCGAKMDGERKEDE